MSASTETQRIVIDDSAEAQEVQEVQETTESTEEALSTDGSGEPAQVADGASTSTDQSLEIQERAQTALESAGLSMDDFTKEFLESGKLSEESFEKLEKQVGLPRDLVEGYIAGQQMLANSKIVDVQTMAYGLTGGQEQYQELTNWAGDNLDQADIAEFNDAVNSMNPSKSEQAIRSLIQRRESSEGYVGTKVTGTPVTSGSGDFYQDKAQLTGDLADPRYSSSSAFRAQVESKLSRSMKFHKGDIPL